MAVSGLNDLGTSGMIMPARGGAALSPARRFASASTTRCRSAHLVEVRSNHRPPPVSTMRQAPAMPHSASSLPPNYRHSRLTVVRRGCEWSRLAGIHGEAMYTAPDCAARAALRATDRQCAGSRGKAPSPFSGDFKRGILFGKRIPLLVGSSVTRCITTPRNARIIMLLCGRKKRQLFCSARCRWRTLSHSAYPGARCG